MRYLDEQDGADVNELAIHLKVSKLDYCQRYAEASAVQAHMKQGYPLAPGMEIGYVIRDARMWEVDSERAASEFDDAYNHGLLEELGRGGVCFQAGQPVGISHDQMVVGGETKC